MTAEDEALARVVDAMEAIRPLLAGLGPDGTSAVLANLTSLWLAGHFARGGTAADTAALRDKMLDMHIALIRDLLPLSEQEILDCVVNRSAPQ